MRRIILLAVVVIVLVGPVLEIGKHAPMALSILVQHEAFSRRAQECSSDENVDALDALFAGITLQGDAVIVVVVFALAHCLWAPARPGLPGTDAPEAADVVRAEAGDRSPALFASRLCARHVIPLDQEASSCASSSLPSREIW